MENSTSRVIILWRYAKFVFIRKKTIKTDFLNIHKDFTFSNSLIYIDFHFMNLVYLSISGIDKKLYNGRIVLNSLNLSYPIKIKATTGNGVFSYVIEDENFAEHILHSSIYKISEIKNNSMELNFPKSLIINRVNAKFSDSSLLKKHNYSVKKHLPKTNPEKLNITVNHTQFKINEYL